MPEPEVSHGAMAALLAALATLAGAIAEYIRRKKTKSPSQLDRIEKMLQTLTRTLVVETPEGGHVTASRALADKLSARLDGIEKLMARRAPQRVAENESIREIKETVEALSRNVDSLSDGVRSAIDIARNGVR